MAKGKVIITCAITGSAHTPSMSPYLPITAEQIATNAIDAAEAGAAILHLHTRDPETGKPSQAVELYKPFLEVIKQRTDAVLNLTTGGATGMPLEERLRPATHYEPEIVSLNMGSMNFGMFAMLNKQRDYRFDWEEKMLASTREVVFKNTFADIEHILSELSPRGTRFEFECYDVSHLYALAHFLDRGLVRAPLFVQTIFGILGGIGHHPEDVLHMRRTADRLFGDQYEWSAFGSGAQQMPIMTMVAVMGGNVRVGLEDSLWAGKGRLAESNAVQVRAARQIVEALGLEVATPAEARAILDLKGGDRTRI